MNRVFRALLIVVCFEMGALLLYLPWSAFWEQNFFLSHFPSLIHVVLHPSFRGAVSGLGVLDILLALSFIGSRSGPSSVPPEQPRARFQAPTGQKAHPLLRHRPSQPAGRAPARFDRGASDEDRIGRCRRPRLDSASRERFIGQTIRR